ncbi:MAG TPA: cytochrome c3 family protein [Albidovulum sp.]|uniref:cytochrome c3 family protein n=1 Tax=Albidovulum sp. TaxID=1872424 RepID=UPI002C597C5F|nr:cytochrome c3 family protein [Albidovulum sp.]
MRKSMVAALLAPLAAAAMLLLDQPPAAQEAPETVFKEVLLNPVPPPAPDQPLPYSHKWHVGTLGVDCSTCHVNPDPGAQMTLPETGICMTCHDQAGVDKPSIQTLTDYNARGEEIPWKRVYRLLPGVTWSHRTHLDAGVDCTTCHGAVPELDQMQMLTSVPAMATCMSCHAAHEVKTTCITCHAWPQDSMLLEK